MTQSKINPIYRKIILFVICISLSAFLWLLNILNLDQTKVINFPVRFTGIPTQYAMMYSLPSNLNFEIKSSGYHFLKDDILEPDKTIEIPLNFTNVNIEKKYNSIIYLDEYKTKIQSQLNHHYELVDILLDTIRIGFDEKWEKKVPVIFHKDIHFRNGYQISSPVKIIPNEITVYGSKSQLDQIQYISTEKIKFENIDHSIEKVCNIIQIPSLKYSTSEVKIIIPVEQFTEKELSVSILKMNEPKNKKLEIIPKKIKIRVLVSLSEYKSLSESDFKIIANYPDESSSIKKIIPEVITKPEFVQIIQIEPNTLDYIIKETK